MNPKKAKGNKLEVHIRLTIENYQYLNSVIENNALSGMTAGVNFILKRDERAQVGTGVGRHSSQRRDLM